MNSFWTKVVVETILQRKNEADKDYSSFELAKGFRELRVTVVELLKDFVLIAFGIASASFGLKGFLLPSKFIDGGATGMALLTTALTGLPLPLLLLIINIPFVFLGYKILGRQVAFKTAVAITGLAICTALVHFPEVTHDKLLVAVFGGFFLGAGIGLTVRGGGVIDGTEVLAIVLSKRFSTTIGDIITVINILIFGIAVYLLSVETALYSMITYLAASKTVDFVVEGIEEYIGVTIISAKNEEIREMITNDLGRGITVYRGKRGFGKHGETNDVDIIYTVMTRLELNKLNTEVEKIDPHAFVVITNVRDTKGGIIKRRPMKH